MTSRDVDLRVTTGLSDALLDDLRAGRLDLVLSTIRPRGRTLQAKPVAEETFNLVASPDLSQSLPAQPTAEDLERLPFVSYGEDLPILRRYWRHVFGRRLDVTPALVVPDLRGIVSAVAAGAGISAVPHYLCQRRVDSGELRLLLDPEDPPTNTGYLVTRSGIASPSVEAVRRLILAASHTWRTSPPAG